VGQSFDAYRAERPNRPSPSRTTLYLQPIGPFRGAEAKLLEESAEMMGIFFGLEVRRLEPIGMGMIPPIARRTHPSQGIRQIDSLFVLDLLRSRRPDDAVAVLALTSSDLWPNETGRSWNFVFGQASLRDRVGVWSIARFGDVEEDFGLVLLRTLKVALHETGHMLGIRHCTAYECGMNGSNHLPESDRQPLWFCPQCEQKVWWACKLAPVARYEKLAAFAESNGLKDEARFWRRSREALDEAPD
jgi:archaemetzincin